MPPPTPARRAEHLRTVVDRQVEESRFRTALTRDLLTAPPLRRRGED